MSSFCMYLVSILYICIKCKLYSFIEIKKRNDINSTAKIQNSLRIHYIHPIKRYAHPLTTVNIWNGFGREKMKQINVEQKQLLLEHSVIGIPYYTMVEL